MKTQKRTLEFSKNSVLELQNGDLASVVGGTFSTNSESGPLCDMIEIISRTFLREN